MKYTQSDTIPFNRHVNLCRNGDRFGRDNQFVLRKYSEDLLFRESTIDADSKDRDRKKNSHINRVVGDPSDYQSVSTMEWEPTPLLDGEEDDSVLGSTSEEAKFIIEDLHFLERGTSDLSEVHAVLLKETRSRLSHSLSRHARQLKLKSEVPEQIKTGDYAESAMEKEVKSYLRSDHESMEAPTEGSTSLESAASSAINKKNFSSSVATIEEVHGLEVSLSGVIMSGANVLSIGDSVHTIPVLSDEVVLEHIRNKKRIKRTVSRISVALKKMLPECLRQREEESFTRFEI